MASPHMAGVAALMKAVKPALTPAELDTLLASGAITTDLGAPGRDDVFGHGLIDARRGRRGGERVARRTTRSCSSSPTGPEPRHEPDAGVLPGDERRRRHALADERDRRPALAHGGRGVRRRERARHATRSTVDRTGLANGTYTGTITVQSSAGNASVSVVMAVVAAATSANAGFHYVLLVDPETLDPVAQVDVAPSGGQLRLRARGRPGGIVPAVRRQRLRQRLLHLRRRAKRAAPSRPSARRRSSRSRATARISTS